MTAEEVRHSFIDQFFMYMYLANVKQAIRLLIYYEWVMNIRGSEPYNNREKNVQEWNPEKGRMFQSSKNSKVHSFIWQILILKISKVHGGVT